MSVTGDELDASIIASTVWNLELFSRLPETEPAVREIFATQAVKLRTLPVARSLAAREQPAFYIARVADGVYAVLEPEEVAFDPADAALVYAGAPRTVPAPGGMLCDIEAGVPIEAVVATHRTREAAEAFVTSSVRVIEPPACSAFA